MLQLTKSHLNFSTLLHRDRTHQIKGILAYIIAEAAFFLVCCLVFCCSLFHVALGQPFLTYDFRVLSIFWKPLQCLPISFAIRFKENKQQYKFFRCSFWKCFSVFSLLLLLDLNEIYCHGTPLTLNHNLKTSLTSPSHKWDIPVVSDFHSVKLFSLIKASLAVPRLLHTLHDTAPYSTVHYNC